MIRLYWISKFRTVIYLSTPQQNMTQRQRVFNRAWASNSMVTMKKSLLKFHGSFLPSQISNFHEDHLDKFTHRSPQTTWHWLKLHRVTRVSKSNITQIIYGSKIQRLRQKPLWGKPVTYFRNLWSFLQIRNSLISGRKEEVLLPMARRCLRLDVWGWTTKLKPKERWWCCSSSSCSWNFMLSDPLLSTATLLLHEASKRWIVCVATAATTSVTS